MRAIATSHGSRLDRANVVHNTRQKCIILETPSAANLLAKTEECRHMQQQRNSQELLLQLQPFYDSLDFVQDNPGEPVPEETFTHAHLSWSSIVSYLLHPSFTIHGILLVQFTCLAVFFHNLSQSFLCGLPLGLAPPLHTPYTSSPNHCLLFESHVHTIAT